jgi:hypothetical protein
MTYSIFLCKQVHMRTTRFLAIATIAFFLKLPNPVLYPCNLALYLSHRSAGLVIIPTLLVRYGTGLVITLLQHLRQAQGDRVDGINV